MKKSNFAKFMHKFAVVLSCAFLVTPAVQCECTTTKSAAMQDVKKEKLIVDCAFSVGHDCAVRNVAQKIQFKVSIIAAGLDVRLLFKYGCSFV